MHITAEANTETDENAIKQVALDYIESQHTLSEERMKHALHNKLAKRTYWKNGDEKEFIMETSFEIMLRVAKTYNKKGDKFPVKPRKEVKILDIDGRIATLKLTADDWIDYMHLIKNDKNEWEIINVLWQYHDRTKHNPR